MDFTIRFNSRGVPNNIFTTVVLGIVGFVWVTAGRHIPDIGILTYIAMLCIMTGWVLYIVASVGFTAVLLSTIRRRIARQHDA